MNYPLSNVKVLYPIKETPHDYGTDPQCGGCLAHCMCPVDDAFICVSCKSMGASDAN